MIDDKSMIKGTLEHVANMNNDDEFCGFNKFRADDGSEYGSFEVFYVMTDGDGGKGTGWYWWPCFPGCLPDGEPTGPFPTAEGAYLSAIGD